MNMKHFTAALCIALMLYACQQPASQGDTAGKAAPDTLAQHPDSLIVPGVSLGKIVLGADAAQTLSST